MKNRPYHTLAGNKGNLRPQNVLFFDTETQPISISKEEDKQVLRLGWACFVRPEEMGKARKPQWLHFTTSAAFWDFVTSYCHDNRKLYLVAHNVAFDFRIVGGFAYMKQNGWTEKFVYDKGLTTIARFKRSKQTIEVLSTTNFFATSLKELGDMVGLEKLGIDFKKASDSDLSTYCRRDVEILVKAWRLWIAFLDEHDLGTFRSTISSQAFGAYRHRFMHTPIAIHSNMEVCEFEREAYRGGRTECFKVGELPEGDYYYLDVNGMYAFQMLTQDFPHKLLGHKVGFPVRALRNKLRNFSCIARVVVNVTEPAFVVKHDNRNVYPVGRFEVVLTTPDLKHAFALNAIEEVKELSWYSQAPIFRSYTQYFTALKQRYEKTGNKPFRDIAKLYVNALYGKFGQTGFETKKTTLDQASGWSAKSLIMWLLQTVLKKKSQTPDLDLGTFNCVTGRWERPPGFKRLATRPKKPAESYNSFPAIVAHVTAYARHYLWQLICKADLSNVFYCDTDSLIVNRKGYESLQELIHPSKLGCLKVEKRGTNLTIYAPKDYVIGSRIRQKGIRKNAVQIGKATYRQDQFLGLAGAIRQGNPDLVTIKKVTKTLRRQIKTGVVQEDGWVIPFQFPL